MQLNERVGTAAGAIILSIIAITVGVFVWVYEKSQNLDVDTATTQPTTTSKQLESKEKSSANTGVVGMMAYVSAKYGFSFEYPENLMITPESTGNNIGISDKEIGHWLYSVVIQENNQDLSLDEALKEILESSPYKYKKVSVTDITLDNKPAKKFSFESSDYGNVAVILVTQYDIVVIHGDDSSSTLKSNFEDFLNTFRFH